MDPLDGVAVFFTVAQCGSFSAAAAKLGCTKSTVSEQITRLERRIGARLVQRSSRAVSLTEAGRAYLCRLDDVLDRVKQAERAAQAEVKEARGPLRISAPDPFAWTHLAPLLPDFLALHPEISIELHVTAEVVDLIAEGFDLAIRLCPTEDPTRIVRRIGRTRLVVAAAPALLQGRALPQVPEDLSALPCLVNSTHPWRKGWRFRQGEESRVVALEPRLIVNNHETLRRLVLAGGGIAALSEYAVTEDLKAGRVVRLLPDWSIVDIPVLAVYPDNRQIAAKVKAFVAFVARRLEPETLMAHLDTPAPRTPFPAKARQSTASARGAAKRA